MSLSLVGFVCLQASAVDLGIIEVEAKVDTQVVKDLHGEALKSADLGEALFKQSPSVSLVRRSGIANDIIVRGQKKDNINVTIDGVKLYGACPDRMDPSVSHVLTNNIDFIEIHEGPYSVEDFGVLSADVKVHTIKPTQEWSGDVNLGYGSWNYQKGAFSLSGGSEKLKVLLSGSVEKSEQYKDGNGDDFVGQIERDIDAGKVSKKKNPQYQARYQNMDAYTKKTLMAKLFWDITDKQVLTLSYTVNRSDDVLYPSSKMDALYDDSDMYNLEYTLKDLGAYSNALDIQLYQSEVTHPMSTKYRNIGEKDYITHALTTKMQGTKLKNSLDVENHTITLGLDYSLRHWDGGYLKNAMALPEKFYHSIYDVDTQNRAFFLKDKIALERWTIDTGLRYDKTKITSKNTTQAENNYDALSGYLFATYQADEAHKYFVGLGKSSRVPDGKELYWIGMPMKMPGGSMKAISIGTPNLEMTSNVEFDIGIEEQLEDGTFKAKAFYSMLDNFIAYNASNKVHNYENVDTTLYGLAFSGTYIVTESFYFDYGVAYQRGKKEHPLRGQSGTNMPEIPALKYNLAANYEWDEQLSLGAEIVGADKWRDFDAENGEQTLDAYTILNLKATKTFGKNIELTLGIDNLFDKTYAVSNTYKDLILLPTIGENEVMLMNEPGRYVYTNLKYRF